ncbi:unnamed protein product [Caretta caretta]
MARKKRRLDTVCWDHEELPVPLERRDHSFRLQFAGLTEILDRLILSWNIENIRSKTSKRRERGWKGNTFLNMELPVESVQIPKRRDKHCVTLCLWPWEYRFRIASLRSNDNLGQ